MTLTTTASIPEVHLGPEQWARSLRSNAAAAEQGGAGGHMVEWCTDPAGDCAVSWPVQ